MTPLKAMLNDPYSRRRLFVTAVALAVTLLTPVALLGGASELPIFLIGVGALIAIIVVCVLLRGADNHVNGTRKDDVSRARSGLNLLLYLSPVILLSLVFPLVSPQLAAAHIAGVQLTRVVLACSITVPWLAQAVCMPVYRLLGDLMEARDMDAITRRFCGAWPGMLLFSLPVIILFALPLWVATRWPVEAVGAYIVLCAAHILFVQSLVLTNIAERRGQWAMAWATYATILLIAPTWWLLPPLAGALVQILPLGRYVKSLRFAQGVQVQNLGLDTLRGLLLGAVLWGDKFMLFLVTGGDFPVIAVFVALLPAVLAYNYYFVDLAPRIDHAVHQLRDAIEAKPLTEMTQRSTSLARIVDRAVVSTGALGMSLCAASTLLLGGLQPEHASLVATSTLAAWAFMMLTLLSYKLDYIGEKRTAQVLGLAHLTACGLLFLSTSISTAYLLLLVFDLVLVCTTWVLYQRHWSQPEYTLFWRHASTW